MRDVANTMNLLYSDY